MTTRERSGTEGQSGGAARQRPARAACPSTRTAVPPYRLAAVAALAAIAACTEAGGGPAAAVRDSAGVTIVENPASLAERPLWTVAADPIVEIGALEGEEAYQLSQVTAVARLSDGRLVVANRGTQELRYYDPTGEHLLTVGREGEGPGEFKGLGTTVVLPGDSVAAYDWNLRRVSYFGPDGTFVRSVNFEFPAGFPMPLGRFADGAWLASRGFTFSPGADGTDIVRDTVPYLVFEPSGSLRDSIGLFPATEFYIRTAGRNAMATSLPFGRSTEAAVVDDRFYAGHNERYEIARYTSAGRPDLIVRLEHPSVPVSDGDLETYKQERLDNTESNFRQQVARNLEEMPYPSTFPAFADLIVDADGHLWVLEYARPGNDERRWTVFSPEGRALGSVVTPPGLRVLEIGRDYVLGVWQDELDVEYVKMHRLDKGGA